MRLTAVGPVAGLWSLSLKLSDCPVEGGLAAFYITGEGSAGKSDLAQDKSRPRGMSTQQGCGGVCWGLW